MRKVWKNLFDVREGEYSRTIFMSFYLLFVLFAYYILGPVSRAMFLSELKVDKLPLLNMQIAVGGGLLAYSYSKLAVRTSLRTAVTAAMALAVVCLLVFWWLVTVRAKWVLYAFNIWVSLFSIVLPTQGWLVAANVFDTRSAKRLYGLLGMGMVVGAASGATFTNFTAKLLGERNLILSSAALVILAYGAFCAAVAQKGVHLEKAKGVEAAESGLKFKDILLDIGRHRHLQVIIGIITLIFVVDTLVDFQFQAMATVRFAKKLELAAFLARFKGIYVNCVTFPLQFLLTAAVVRRLGVGGTLQIMPVSIALTSLGTVFFPGLGSTMLTRLTEASTRYTLNKTGLELLYLPLPADLRNRTKVFVDIFMDRGGRGLGGALLMLFLAVGLRDIRQIAAAVIVFTMVWMLLSWRARKEYIQTVRGRLAMRRLDLDSLRMRVSDPATVALLEETAAGAHTGQACYALSLLAEVEDYELSPLLCRLAAHDAPEMRGKVYEVAWFTRFGELCGQARDEVARSHPDTAVLKPAVMYLISFATEPARLAGELLQDPRPEVAESALEAMATQPEWAQEAITDEWLAAAAGSAEPARRALAAFAIRIRGDQGTAALHRLLEDPEPAVAIAACRAAGATRNRGYVDALVRRLADARIRAAAVEALAAFGASITGTLADVLEDGSVPAVIRRQIPRVLKLVSSQRNVDVLLKSIGHQDLAIRAAVLKALNRLRERAPEMNYGETFVTTQILAEARHYFELRAALAPLRDCARPRTAAGLLARTLEERCRQTIERLFRLLGLRYPQREIYAAYLAVNGRRTERLSAALEFLESVLERPLRRIVVPVLDAPDRVLERGRDLFGIDVPDAEAAVRELIRSGDPWLMACAVATAAEQGFQRLVPEISQAAQRGGAEVSQVARAAAAALG